MTRQTDAKTSQKKCQASSHPALTLTKCHRMKRKKSQHISEKGKKKNKKNSPHLNLNLRSHIHTQPQNTYTHTLRNSPHNLRKKFTSNLRIHTYIQQTGRSQKNSPKQGNSPHLKPQTSNLELN